MLPKGTKEAANIALSKQRDYVAQVQKTCSLSHLANSSIHSRATNAWPANSIDYALRSFEINCSCRGGVKATKPRIKNNTKNWNYKIKIKKCIILYKGGMYNLK